jgi:uncharacterized membrane protein
MEGGGTPRLNAAFLRSPYGWPYLLVPLIPAAVALELLDAGAGIVFVAAALGIIPTAALMGRATEELAARSGPGIGGLLNVTFGNAPELIIALFALGQGLHEVVKASIVGSILGNILLVLGAAMLAGGIGREKQTFSRTTVSVQTTMLLLAAAALLMPAIFELVEGKGLPQPGAELIDYGPTVEHLSLAVALVLMVTYVAGLVFSLKTHRDIFNPEYEDEDSWGWSVRTSVIALAIAGVRGTGRLDQRGLAVGRPLRVLHRCDRRRDRRQRRRALGRGPGRDEGQDGPIGQHRDRLQRPGGALRRAGARPCLLLHRAAPARARLQRIRAGRDPARGGDRQLRDPGRRVELVRGRAAARRLRRLRDRLLLRLSGPPLGCLP